MALRLLIVDDESDICAFFREVATEIGYDAVATHSAQAFKAEFARTAPDVILLDLTLPGTDGIELLRYLSEMGTRARILIVSGYDEGIRKMAYTIGAARGLDMAGVLPKPVRLADLRGLLRQFKADAEGA